MAMEEKDLKEALAKAGSTSTPKANASDPKAPPASEPTTTTAPVTTTSEFSGDAKVSTDPTMPVKKNGMVSRAEKPIKVETLTIDDKKIEVATYRVFEKDGTLKEIAYEVGTGHKLTKDGREDITALNRETLSKINESLASMKHNHGPKIKLMDYLRKYSLACGVTTPNNVVPELIVVADRDKNANLDQKRYKTVIRDKSTGGVKTWLLVVPTRAFDFITEGNAMDIDTINEIVSDTAPSTRMIGVPKDDFPMMLLSVFGGPIRVLSELYDENTAIYASVKEIPSVNGLPAGAEYIYYMLDTKKVGLNSTQPKQKSGESQESFGKRIKAWADSQEMGQKFRAGGLKLEEKASVIRIRSNARTSMVSSRNYIPFRTFETTPVGVVSQPARAREMNAMYLRKMEAKDIVMAASEGANLTIHDNKIESSIYFPVDAGQANKIPQIKQYFKTRDAAGKLVKATYTPRAIIAKEMVKTEKGDNRPLNKAASIGEPGYNNSQYSLVRSLFNSAISKLPESQRCTFISEEEIVAANKRARTSTVSTKISSTSVDKSLLDAQIMMMSLAVDNGSVIVDINDTTRSIDGIRDTRVQSVVTNTRLSPEQQAKLEAAMKAKTA